MGEGERREPQNYEKHLTATVAPSASASVEVERGLNGIRLAILGILVTIGLAVGFGVPGAWWVKLIAGVVSFAIACGAIKWRRSQQFLMSFVHRLTGL